MKKSYTKPQLWAESFQPSDAIAGPCSINVGFGDIGASKPCGYQDPDVANRTLFNAAPVCTTQWDDKNDGQDDYGCYHVPTDTMKYFGS